MAATLDANLGSNDYASGTPLTRTLVTTAAAAAGTYIGVAVTWFGAQTISSVSDGTAYTLLKLTTNGSDHTAIYGRFATAGLASGASIVITYSGSLGGAVLIGAASFSGVASTGTLDTTGTATGTGASISSGAATSSVAGSLYFGAIGIEDATNPTTGTATSGTKIHDRYRVADQQGLYTAFLVAGSPASQAVTATLSNSNSTANTGALVILLAAAGGGGSVTAVPAAGVGGLVAPGVSAGSTVTSPPEAAVGSLPAPAVSATGSASITAPVAGGVGGIPIPSISAGSTITAPPADGVGSLPPTNQIISVVVNTDPAEGTGALPTPSVSGGTSVTETPPAASGTGDIPTPGVSVGSNITSPAGGGIGEVPAPTISSGSSVTAPDADATGGVPVPSISGTSNASATSPAASAVGSLPTPSVSGGDSILLIDDFESYTSGSAPTRPIWSSLEDGQTHDAEMLVHTGGPDGKYIGNDGAGSFISAAIWDRRDKDGRYELLIADFNNTAANWFIHWRISGTTGVNGDANSLWLKWQPSPGFWELGVVKAGSYTATTEPTRLNSTVPSIGDSIAVQCVGTVVTVQIDFGTTGTWTTIFDYDLSDSTVLAGKYPTIDGGFGIETNHVFGIDDLVGPSLVASRPFPETRDPVDAFVMNHVTAAGGNQRRSYMSIVPRTTEFKIDPRSTDLRVENHSDG